jgi:putative MATE family efflux protein
VVTPEVERLSGRDVRHADPTDRKSERRALDRRILRLAVPALFTLAVEPLYVLVDTAIVGHLGTVPLGGLALATTVLATLLWAFNFLVYGTTPRVAFLMGAGDERGAAGVAAQGLWLCGVLGIPLAGLILLGGNSLATALGGHGAILHAAVTYLRISALSTPAVLIALVGQGYLRGLSDTVTPFRVVIVANVLNVMLEVVLVYGFDLGVAGSAWGTVVAQWLAAAWFVRMCGRRIRAAGAALRPDRTEMTRLVTAGRHLFVRTAALLGALALATAVAARVSAATLAAHQIGYQIFLFLALTVDALAIAGQAMVGTQLGAARPDDARAIAYRLGRLAVLFGAAIGAVLLAASPVLPHVFTADPAVVHRATVALALLAAMQVPGAVAFVLGDGVLLGAGDYKFVKWSLILALAVFVPFAVAVLRWHRLGIAGIWIGLIGWMITRAVLSAVRIRGDRWTAGAL